MLIKIASTSIIGIDAQSVIIEIDIRRGVGFFLVGLPDLAVKESFHRVSAAIANNNYKWPGKKIIINLAPADMLKAGTAYDLPIAIGVLIASEQIDVKYSLEDECLILGELALDGTLRPIKGALSSALLAKEKNIKKIIVPLENVDEASIVKNVEVFGVQNIKEAIDVLTGKNEMPSAEFDWDNLNKDAENSNIIFGDMDEVIGQQSVKRALEVAASGGHNLIMIGPPGSGKSMLAKRYATILPPMTVDEALETTKIHSISGKLNPSRRIVFQRPFRSPHHTISDVALVGGGSYPSPGEISLAHNGVLFLDEFPEFKKSALETLRQPLEDRKIIISRAKYSITYPTNFSLVAAMNPTPSGHYENNKGGVQSSFREISKYLSKISGPLLDRIDIHIEANAVPIDQFSKNTQKSENSKTIRERVIKARNIQLKRFKEENIFSNAQMTPRLLKKYCKINDVSLEILKKAMDKYNFSTRAYDRILKLSRTIADMDNSTNINPTHLIEAIKYRILDRDIFNS